MTTFNHIDQAITARGIRYDTGDEQFYDGNRPLDVDAVLAISGDVTLDELASYQDDRYDKLAAHLARKKG